MNSSPPSVSVVTPLKPAMERVKDILFRPFNFEKWIAVGFCAWLAGLAGGGSSFNYHFNHSSHEGKLNLDSMFGQTKEYILHNLSWIMPVFAAGVVFFVALVLLLLWLGSRGQFMFLHCVALNRAEVSVPWKKFGREAASLWLFRLALAALMLANLVIFASVIIWTLVKFHHQQHHFSASLLAALIPVILAFAIACLVLGVIKRFTLHFVVPIMFLRGGTCSEAWQVFLGVLSVNSGRFLLYLLFQIVLKIAIILAVLLAVLCTCCLGGLLLLVPFVGTVILLPVTVFERSYQLHYLAQYGEEFDVFRAF